MAFQFGTKKMKERQAARQLKRKRKKIESIRSKGITTRGPKQGKGYKLTDEIVSKSGKIRKKSKEQVVTKGGVYQKYDKKSKAAGSFRSAFKKGCAGGSKGFSWDGRSYSCAKASDKPKPGSKKFIGPMPRTSQTYNK